MPDKDIMILDEKLVTVNKLLQQKIFSVRELFEQRFNSMDKALQLQLIETLRRLDDLNHAHQQARDIQNTYVPRELYDTTVIEWSSWRTSIEARHPLYVTFSAMDRRTEVVDQRLADINLKQALLLPREVFETYIAIPFLPREVHEQYAVEQRKKADELAKAIVKLSDDTRIMAEGLVKSAAERAEMLAVGTSERADVLALSATRRFSELDKKIENIIHISATLMTKEAHDKVFIEWADWRRMVDHRATGFLTLDAAARQTQLIDKRIDELIVDERARAEARLKLSMDRHAALQLRLEARDQKFDAQHKELNDRLNHFVPREVFDRYTAMPYLPREIFDQFVKDQQLKADSLIATIPKIAIETRIVAEELSKRVEEKAIGLAEAVSVRAETIDRRMAAIELAHKETYSRVEFEAYRQAMDDRFGQFRNLLETLNTTMTGLQSSLSGQASGSADARTNADRSRTLVFALIGAVVAILGLLGITLSGLGDNTSSSIPLPSCAVAVSGQSCQVVK